MAKVKEFFQQIFIDPVKEFMEDSRAVGVLLLLCTMISLWLSNISFGEAYLAFWNTSFNLPSWLHIPHSLLHSVNDILMAVFFFLVGMEIRRELLRGELSSFRQAVLPLAAAIGGMIIPALIYAFFNNGTEYAHGWGVPMATDIAFSLGVAALLGSKVPASLKIFLMALAIIDDLGAILVIALFYGGDLNLLYLALSAVVCIAAALLNYFKMMNGFLLVIAGLVLWYLVFNSGIHATVAGVLLALFVPAEKLEKYEHILHKPVNFIILPVFALANTAIIIPGNLGAALGTSLSWGVIAGLLIGKPAGITLFSWLAVMFKWGQKPTGSSWMQLLGVGVLASIGFTMSIFITMLAFGNNAHQDISKIAVMIASLAAMILGIFIFFVASLKDGRQTNFTLQKNEDE